MKKHWRHKTLTQLEKRDYGDLMLAPTSLTARCLSLVNIPLEQFTIEDLRLMIGQGFGLPFLIPLALEHLSTDLFAEGDYFPGDLLKNVLSIDPDFWKEHTLLRQQVNNLIKNRPDELQHHRIGTDLFDSSPGFVSSRTS